MTAAAVKKPRETLTLRDGVDLYLELNRWIEDHIDELELSGGALPDDLAQILDEVDASNADRADAIAFKIDEFTGYATTAKATKDRAARRQKVWENTIASIKAYALRQVERTGDDRIRGTTSVLRIQRNSAPSTELTAPPESQNDVLLAVVDTNGALARFITVKRTPTLDRKALGAAYEARRATLEAETELLGESDVVESLDADAAIDVAARTPAELAQLLADMRARYIADNLAAEFPGVSCVRGHHLRID